MKIYELVKFWQTTVFLVCQNSIAQLNNYDNLIKKESVMTQDDRVRWLDKIKPHNGALHSWSLSVKAVPAAKLPALSQDPRSPLPYDTLLVSTIHNPTVDGTVVTIGAVCDNQPVPRGMAAVLHDSGAIDLVRDYVVEKQSSRNGVMGMKMIDLEIFKGKTQADAESSSLVHRFDSFLQLVEGRELSAFNAPSL